MIMQNRAAEDRREYGASYIANRGYAVGMNEAFNQEMGRREQTEEAAIPAMMTPGSNGKSAVQMLRANPTPGMIKQFDSTYGPGSSRIWLGA